MSKQQSMLDHIIENLGNDDIAKLTDWCQETFPDVAATFAQRKPNRRETWIMGLMAGHTWHVRVIYKEFRAAFLVGALTDTYSDSRCQDILVGTLNVCCPGWKTVSEENVLYILLPVLDDVRASCEKEFGKRSWPPTDEEAMIPIRQAAAEEAAALEKKDARETALLKIVLEYREATLDINQRVMAKERRLESAVREAAYRKKDGGDGSLFVEEARSALEEARSARAAIVEKADARRQEQYRRRDAGEDLLGEGESIVAERPEISKLST